MHMRERGDGGRGRGREREREREGGDVDRRIERCVCVRERERNVYNIIHKGVTQGKHAYILWQKKQQV